MRSATRLLHLIDNVRKDLLVARTRIRRDGYICGDDYTLWCGPLLRMGVVEAVNEFCNTYGYELAFLTNSVDRCLSYALRMSDPEAA